jgi:glycosyltransferase involved in cell wall biosynthesis
VRILAFPRDTANPYQRLLYSQMQALGVPVGYLGQLTPSHTLNVLLLPAELAARRLRGGGVVHLHWVHGFAITGAGRLPVLRRAAQAWFAVCLVLVRLLGFRLVWTAHNVLPHDPVFADDSAARRRLVRACDLVIAHSAHALAELGSLGAVPRRAIVVPHGPLALGSAAGLRIRTPGSGGAPRRLLFFGRVLPYKGLDELVEAFAALPADVPAVLTVAGECADPALRSRLRSAAGRSGGRVTLRLERLTDEQAAELLAVADAVVLPFRRVTTSGSAVLALCHGRPLVVPDLPALADLPAGALFRYAGTPGDLTRALTDVARAQDDALAAASAAALAYARGLSWPDIAARTVAAMRDLPPRRQQARSGDGALAAR